MYIRLVTTSRATIELLKKRAFSARHESQPDSTHLRTETESCTERLPCAQQHEQRYRRENSVSRIRSTGNIASVAMNVYRRRLTIRLFCSSHVELQKSLLIGIGVEQMRQCLCFTITGAVSF